MTTSNKLLLRLASPSIAWLRTLPNNRNIVTITAAGLFVVASYSQLACDPGCEARLTCETDSAAGGGGAGGASSAGGSGGGNQGGGGTAPLSVRALAANQRSVCALVREGETWCWGVHHYGDSEIHSVPEQIPGTGIGIAVGSNHTCRLTPAGEIECWGANDRGQLGNGSTDDSDTPTIVNAEQAVAVVAGGRNTCAVTVSGATLCWGDNSASQVATATGSVVTTPHNIQFQNAEKVSFGASFGCALRSGTSWCWGNNSSNQANPLSTQGEVGIPTAINIGATVSDVSARGSNACAAMTDGAVWCWGDNGFGQLGPGGSPLAPFEALGLNNAIAIDTGLHHCAIRQDKTLWCWGLNSDGELGIGSYEEQTTPSQVQITCPVALVTTGNHNTCAMCEDSSVWCWGDNHFGMLGIGGAGGNSNVPVQVGPF